jgi:uncharacterized RDD family membrane protein YckC
LRSASTTGTPVIVYASPWRRLAAWTIDFLLLLLVILILEIDIFADCTGEGCLAGLAPFLFAPLLVPFYSIPLIHLGGRTLGMKAVGVRAQVAGGSPPTLGRAALRWLVGDAPWILFFLGWVIVLVVRLPILWDAQRRGLHDRSTGTVVVRSGRS